MAYYGDGRDNALMIPEVFGDLAARDAVLARSASEVVRVTRLTDSRGRSPDGFGVQTCYGMMRVLAAMSGLAGSGLAEFGMGDADPRGLGYLGCLNNVGGTIGSAPAVSSDLLPVGIEARAFDQTNNSGTSRAFNTVFDHDGYAALSLNIPDLGRQTDPVTYSVYVGTQESAALRLRNQPTTNNQGVNYFRSTTQEWSSGGGAQNPALSVAPGSADLAAEAGAFGRVDVAVNASADGTGDPQLAIDSDDATAIDIVAVEVTLPGATGFIFHSLAAGGATILTHKARFDSGCGPMFGLISRGGLVEIDVCVNDAINLTAQQFEDGLTAVIAAVRAADPNATIMVYTGTPINGAVTGYSAGVFDAMNAQPGIVRDVVLAAGNGVFGINDRRILDDRHAWKPLRTDGETTTPAGRPIGTDTAVGSLMSDRLHANNEAAGTARAEAFRRGMLLNPRRVRASAARTLVAIPGSPLNPRRPM